MEDFSLRTRRFAVDVFRFCRTLPPSQECRVITWQLIRSASSVAANYRGARRAQSKAGFLSKLAIVDEEADESLFWLEMIMDLEIDSGNEIRRLRKEADEITAIAVAMRRSGKRGL